MIKAVILSAMVAVTIPINGLADDMKSLQSNIEFDINRLYDCYNSGEIIFFRDGRMTYDGDDFTLREPTQWLASDGRVEPGDKIGLEITRVDIDKDRMRIELFDLNGKKRLYDQDALPEVGDQWEVSISDGVVAFALEFEHRTAMLDLTFDVFDPGNPDNRSSMNYGLNCP